MYFAFLIFDSVISQYLHVDIIVHSMGLFTYEAFAKLMFKEMNKHLTFQIDIFICSYIYDSLNPIGPLSHSLVAE